MKSDVGTTEFVVDHCMWACNITILVKNFWTKTSCWAHFVVCNNLSLSYKKLLHSWLWQRHANVGLRMCIRNVAFCLKVEEKHICDYNHYVVYTHNYAQHIELANKIMFRYWFKLAWSIIDIVASN